MFKRLFVPAFLILACCLSLSANAVDVSEDTYGLYLQYKKIVEEVATEYDASIDFVTFENFEPESMDDIDVFRDTMHALARLTDPQRRFFDSIIATSETDVALSQSARGSIEQYVKKTNRVSVGTRTATVEILGAFGTYYDSDHQRNLFNHYEIVDISCPSSSFTWETTAFDGMLIDRMTTYYVVAEGDITYNGSVWTGREVSAEFHCNPSGEIT